ncbi:ATP-dependent nuclease [Cryobacterium lyxosi]|uniref:AAA family ATPase n=1 Tax=Cryobacterium lyxosi TaxID=1259228 RepID=A0A4R8ZIY7_9MICO|nr:ATP-binding protein [Cryobacterium lyxosi]TFD27356.1 AAA family ATPase [Cryobacterium lyxosi]
MKIRRLKISNYRGIKSLDWVLPTDERLICLIGPGDSGKSSILEGLHLLLGDRWNPSLADTDFFNCDVSEPIVIRAAITDLPAHLLKETAYGLWLSGIDTAGEVSQDPTDETEPCIIVQLRIDDSLEPVWTVERLLGGEGKPLNTYARREFATFKVDERIDVHLRWTRTSALGRLSDKGSGAKNAMAIASRAAREALASIDDADLTAVADRVQDQANLVGGGRFTAIHPGLDTSMASAGGNLALYEGLVPLAGYGLGSKRLTGIAVQQLAAGQRSTVLIDEVEHGLEPHRLVRLLQHLLGYEEYSQVFITTHSPVVVEQSQTESLAVVRNDAGSVVVHSLATSAGDVALRLRRSRPSSFLARRIIVAEGKTEHGLLMKYLETWDEDRRTQGLSISAGDGTVIQDAQGGSEVAIRATALRELGYDVAVLVDNDDTSIDDAIAAASAAGVEVFRWDTGLNTESQVVMHLDQGGVERMLDLGIDMRNDRETVLLDLKKHGLPAVVDTLSLSDWFAAGVTDLAAAKEMVMKAMIKSKWFKDVDSGRRLGEWLMVEQELFQGTSVEAALAGLRAFAYPARPSGEEEAQAVESDD